VCNHVAVCLNDLLNLVLCQNSINASTQQTEEDTQFLRGVNKEMEASTLDPAYKRVGIKSARHWQVSWLVTVFAVLLILPVADNGHRGQTSF
jgi:hypothetical protein